MNAILRTHRDDDHISNQLSDLIADTMYLILGKSSGHMLPHSYDSVGMKFWEAAVDHPLLPANKESKLVSDPDNIHRIVNQLARLKSNPAFVELGPGLPQSVLRKTVPLLKHFQAVTGRPIEYHAFDISPEAARDCAELVEREIPGSTVSAIHGNFLHYDGKLETSGKPSVGIMWGGTWLNAPTHPGMRDDFVIAGNGDKISRLLGEDAHLLQTYYWAPSKNPNLVLEPYKTKAVEGLIGNILNVIRDKVEPDFDPSKFRIRISYDEKLQRVSYEAECVQGHSVRFKKLDNFSRVFQKGERLHLASSHKRTTLQLGDLLRRQMSHDILANAEDEKACTGLILSHHSP